MNEIGLRIVFFCVWIVIGMTFAYRLLVTPDWIDQHVEKMEISRGRPLSTKKNRPARYRFVGIVLLLSSLLAIVYVIQDIASLSYSAVVLKAVVSTLVKLLLSKQPHYRHINRVDEVGVGLALER